MNTRRYLDINRVNLPRKQKGVVLFFALIGLVVLMLAAVALVRSVDTATVISGNLAFRQAATSSGDAGMEKAITWLNTANTNVDAKASGYYSSINTIDLTADATWQAGASVGIGGGAACAGCPVFSDIDASGNTVRYVIERMCSAANVAPTESKCLYSDLPIIMKNVAGIPTPSPPDNSPLYRITAKVTGPRNTISYIQGIVY